VIQLPDVIKNAVEALTKLPGVGEKTAFRMVMNMTNWKPQELMVIGDALTDLKNLRTCSECGMFSDDHLCVICQDEFRESQKSLCIVETASDLMAIEKIIIPIRPKIKPLVSLLKPEKKIFIKY
jgi:recombination protein RecR